MIVLEGGDGAVISNNVFVLPTNSQSSQIDIQNSTNIKFLNNTIRTEAGNNQIALNSGCSNCVIGGNSFTNCASGKTAVTLAGSNNIVRDNDFLGSGQIITASGSNNIVMNNIALNSSSSTFISGSVAVKKGNYNNGGTEL